MTNSFIKKQIAIAVSCAIALGITATPTAAQVRPAEAAYLSVTAGGVVKSDFGLCWHTSFGPAPLSTLECDPNHVAAPVATVIEPASRPAAMTREPSPLATLPAEPMAAGTDQPMPPTIVQPVTVQPVSVQPVSAATVEPAGQSTLKPDAERVTLDTDALFDFDKAVLRPAGRVALDRFVERIRDMDPEMIMAVGHTDRLGSAEYNQRLSLRRVEAVKAYLVSKGIESKGIHTEGRGETQPVTKAGDCEGAESARVIACLQPDRRVDVEVVGTKVVGSPLPIRW